MDRRVFLGWSEPLLVRAVEWLWDRRSELAGMLVVVPTAQAGRRLREALAVKGACLAPKVVTPGFFLMGGEQAASAIEASYAWIDVLRGVSSKQAPGLFPVEPVERSFAWGAGVAREIEKVRGLLAEEGKRINDVVAVSPETERWRDLLMVEERVMERFEHWEMADPVRERRMAVEAFEMPVGFEQIVFAGVPDPGPLAVRAWQRVEEAGIGVTVLVHAPESEREGFDQWGLPVLDDYWISKPCPVSLDRIHVTAGATELAGRVLSCFESTSSDQAAVGLCDAEFGPALEASFAAGGWPAWNPEGRVAGRSMVLMLEDLAALTVRTESWEAAARVLRNPLMAEVLGRKDLRLAMERLDALENEYLPDGLTRVRELVRWKMEGEEESCAGLKKLLEMIDWCEGWRDAFFPGKCGKALVDWVESMQSREVDDGADGQLYQMLSELSEGVCRLENRGVLGGKGEALELVLSETGSLRSADGREKAVVDLLGWLELSYEGGKRMVLAGLHEGCVPDGNMDDAFLPDAVKSELKLRDAKSRMARDSYLFHSLANSRELDVVVAKVVASGDPRKPSRLLLAAEGRELAERVGKLFGQPDGVSERLAGWDRGEWKLEFDGPLKPYLDGERKLSPTAISGYLFCPFRFYLQRVLKWDRYDAGKLEMDAMDFGNLCHTALEKLGEDLPESEDVKEVTDYLFERVDDGLRRFGNSLSLPLLVQREAARTRLARFADLEVASRQEGWRTKHVELKVGKEDHQWEISGQAMSMQIDRIDYHPKLGWRVLDYKTSAKAKTPKQAHLKKLSEARRRFGPAMEGYRKAEEAWMNVQLPLYAMYAKEWLGLSEVPAVGYVNLPTSLNEVGFSIWEDFSEERMEVAREWIETVIAAMRAGLHWAPVALNASEQRIDDFAVLAPDGLEAAVEGSLIEEMKVIATSWDVERGLA